jgi:hypothetical protein
MNSVLRATLLCAVGGFVVSPVAVAQDAPQLITRTISLRHLSATDAARLVSPYVRAPQGGVFDAGAVQAITVVETAPTVARIDSIIRANDRSPAVLVFRFQVIAAGDTLGRDPAIDSLEATLRSLFRFRSYRLIGQGTTTAGENESFSLTLAAGEERFGLVGDVVRVEGGEQSGGDTGSVRVRVRLAHASGGTYQGKPRESETLLSTGLTVPIGQTVVLGSAAPGGRTQALILTIRPEVAIPSRR